MSRLAIIADTHGLIRPSALAALEGCEAILHAGDIGHPRVMYALEEIAPVVAIKGNVDRAEWATNYSDTYDYRWANQNFFLIHNLREINFDPSGRYHVVIHGHSHQPSLREEKGVLYFNPGSIGPRRFRLPISMGYIECEEGKLKASHHRLTE